MADVVCHLDFLFALNAFLRTDCGLYQFASLTPLPPAAAIIRNKLIGTWCGFTNSDTELDKRKRDGYLRVCVWSNSKNKLLTLKETNGVRADV